MKPVVIFIITFVLLIPITTYAQYTGNVGDSEAGSYTLEEALEIQKRRIASAEANPAPGSQTLPTDKATLDVKITYDEIKSDTQTKVNIDFINPQTQKIQEHIDYTVSISKEEQTVFGPIPLTHTSVGSVRLPVEFDLGEGIYTIEINVEGILFQPIPQETVSFNIIVNEGYSEPKIPLWVKNIFGWYAADQVSEDELLNAIKYLINEGILIVD